MKLKPEAIAEFKQIFAEEHGITLTDEQAQKEASDLLLIIKTIYRPIPKTQT